ncbi:hypothetical protein HMPREF0454_04080 [Hafnia alvei ATCC 51873]|uniref:Uncharacterized protein n=1 Tax=Hafnia alvei ATCC 51873 TaxID=1002364 RepID=G9YBQ1_HAFAL|nr:hypothetical protein HMPREF0454_04080 [Hafnia alvei ATCC 51873]
MAIATANANFFIDDHKAILSFVHRATRTHFGTGRIATVVTRNGQIIGKHILVIHTVVFLPVTTRIFINAAEANVWRQIFKIFAGQLAGFAAGATTRVDIKAVLRCHQLLLMPW